MVNIIRFWLLQLMYKYLLLSTLFALSINLNSFADVDFPITYKKEVKSKDFGISLFYSDNFTTDNKQSTIELRGEIKAHFLDDTGKGIMSELSYQHMTGTNPSIIYGLVPSGELAHSHDGSAFLGYKFPISDSFSVYPFVKGRAVVTRGRGGDNIYGIEPGAGFEWKIYPETLHMNLRYGAMLPVLHRFDGNPDLVNPMTSFLLSNMELRLNYRFLPDFDVVTAYHLRQFPKDLGNSGFRNNETFIWNGVLIGLSYVF